MKQKAALIILDGFGYREEVEGNAIRLAQMHYYESLWKNYPHTILRASGLAVGLPEGQMGNSEVGHLNIGAGRIVYQTYTKIDQAIENGSFFSNSVIQDCLNYAKKNHSRLHLIGLLSDGGVHSHIRHFEAMLLAAKKQGIQQVFVHAFLDGRDVPPTSALTYIKSLEKTMQELGIGKIATIGGRYYGMDRDNRWERVLKAYEAIVYGKGLMAASAQEAIEEAYARKETDEFVLPTVVDKNGVIQDKDAVFFVNFRPDRAREISQALGLKDFQGFPRTNHPDFYYATMAEYDATFPFPVAFPPENMQNILSQVLSQKKIRQLRIAETEKYAHVTFFFNGQIENPFDYEDRILIPSPKVATYDLKPEMSAIEVTETLLQKIENDPYDVFIINYANPDMVGHTGNLEATIKALKAIDSCLEKVVESFKKHKIPVLIIADHGNADEMLDKEGNPMTAHTTNPVPCILVSEEKWKLRENGILADVAPTLLELLEIQKPTEMTGHSLIVR